MIKEEYEDRIQWVDENGELHRNNGPAIEYKNGKTVWYIHGMIHRTNGPAVEFKHDGGGIQQEWWIKGKLHREDGPAVIKKNGKKEYWKHGEEYTEEEYIKLHIVPKRINALKYEKYGIESLSNFIQKQVGEEEFFRILRNSQNEAKEEFNNWYKKYHAYKRLKKLIYLRNGKQN